MTSIQADPAAEAPPVVDDYVDAVASLIGSLPSDERDDLLADVRAHLDEALADDEVDLGATLGSPGDFAREFLSSAGVEVNGDGSSGDPSGPGALRRSADVLRERIGRLRTAYPELDPAWAVARGWIWAVLVAALAGAGVALVPRPGGSILVGAAIVVLGVWASLRLTRRREALSGSRGLRWLDRAGSTVAVVAGVLLAVGSGEPSPPPEIVTFDDGVVGECLINANGAVIENLYPYDSDGTALSDVLLYDQTGHPLDNLCPLETDATGRRVDTTYARDINGAPVINVFPRVRTRSDVTDGVTGPQTEAVTDGEVVPPPAVVIPKLTTTSTTATTTTTIAATTTVAAPAPTDAASLGPVPGP